MSKNQNTCTALDRPRFKLSPIFGSDGLSCERIPTDAEALMRARNARQHAAARARAGDGWQAMRLPYLIGRAAELETEFYGRAAGEA